MEITGSRNDSSLGDLSGKLTDILVHSTVGVIHIDVDCNVFEAAKKMRDHKVGALMVVEKDTLSGIFTERDLMIRVIAEGHDPKKVKVSEYMTSSVATAPPETPNTYGSASGFRNSICINTPANPSIPPTTNAVAARGKRS